MLTINKLPIIVTLRRITLLLCVSPTLLAQIYAPSTSNGAISLTPDGMKGRSNSTNNSRNIALGDSTLMQNTSGINNTAAGNSALLKNTTGSGNTAVGSRVMRTNESGSFNTAVGFQSLLNNQNSNNIGVGAYTLSQKVPGTTNIAFGSYALHRSVSHSNIAVGWGSSSLNGFSDANPEYNISLGYSSLTGNVYGRHNIAIGVAALWETAVDNPSNNNIGIGFNAFRYNRDGKYNVTVGGQYAETYYGPHSSNNSTVIGYEAIIKGNYTNATAIGYYAQVNASNKIRFGNAQVTVIEGAVPLTTPSDRRSKEHIVEKNTLGLEFISRLQTVSYHYSADTSRIRHDGFIAQDVEKIMQNLNVQFSGLRKSAHGEYTLAYDTFVMPLVNAVKELNQQADALKAQSDRIELNQKILSAQTSAIDEIKAELARLKGK